MDRKILKWNFVFQYGWVLTNIFNSILLLPLYLKNIDAATLGIWWATGSILLWMTIVDPGIGEVLQQKVAESKGRKEYNEIELAIGSGYIASIITLFIAIVLGFVCFLFIDIIIDKDISQYPHLSMALVISIIATGMSLVSFTMSGINQGLHNSANVAICGLSANFLFLFVNLVFLYQGYGVLSIAIANLIRSIFINAYNITSMLQVLKKMSLSIKYDLRHFKKFIRIFSFTSSSKIISGLSSSVDMLVLARYVPPALITVFEINKRPTNIVSALIGRHSVALMPSISYAKGIGDKSGIQNLIHKHFKFYSYAALFATFMFCLNYEDLITIWLGKGQYASNLITYLLVANFFVALLCTFMSNVGYALGDIKMNSLFTIIRNLIYGAFIFLAAKYYGIVGALSITLFMTLIADFLFYNYRAYKLGYLGTVLIKTTITPWLFIVPLSVAAGLAIKFLIENMIPPDMYLSKLVVCSGLFTLFFLLLVILFDGEMHRIFKNLSNKIFFNLFSKKVL